VYLTHPEIQQLDLLRDKRPSDRFLLMVQLIVGQIKALKAGLRYKHPDIDEEELEQCLKSTMKKIYSLKP
jgi:hypothetical protein